MHEAILECLGVLAVASDASSESSGGENFLRFLGRLHPLLVHFPIGLALTAALVELINIIRRKATASPFAFMATGFAAGFAVVAALFGWFNADFEGAGPKTTLFLHRWIGTISAGALVFVFFCGMAGRTGRRISALNGYRWGLVICAIMVSIGAHFGGEMVYGEGYLTKVLFPPSSAAAAETPDASDTTTDSSATTSQSAPVSFEKQVLPIFDARCVECHGPDKAKGDLRLDSASRIFGEDPTWWVVQPGDAKKSILVERITLPEGHADVMPAKGELLSADQIALISAWINQGATYESDGKAVSPAAQEKTETTDSKPTSSDAAAAPTANDPALDDAVTRLRDRGVIVMPVAQDTNDWELNTSFANPPFDDEAIGLMGGMEPVLVTASFARSNVTDAGMPGLKGFQKISTLRLDNTSVGDAGMDALLALKNIEMLNLYGTQVGDAGVAKIAALPNLKRLYCAGTKATVEGVQKVQAAHPNVEIVGPMPPPPPKEEAKPAEAEKPKPAETEKPKA